MKLCLEWRFSLINHRSTVILFCCCFAAFLSFLWLCLTLQGYTLKGRPEDSGEVFWKLAMRVGSPAGSYIRVASASSVTPWWGVGQLSGTIFVPHLHPSRWQLLLPFLWDSFFFLYFPISLHNSAAFLMQFINHYYILSSVEPGLVATLCKIKGLLGMLTALTVLKCLFTVS